MVFAPTSLINDLLKDGVILDNTIKSQHDLQKCLLERSVTNKVIVPERDMNDWELGGRPDLLPDDDDDEQDSDNGHDDF